MVLAWEGVGCWCSLLGIGVGGFGMAWCWVLGGNCFLNWKNTGRRETEESQVSPSGLAPLSLKRQFRTKKFHN